MLGGAPLDLYEVHRGFLNGGGGEGTGRKSVAKKDLGQPTTVPGQCRGKRLGRVYASAGRTSFCGGGSLKQRGGNFQLKGARLTEPRANRREIVVSAQGSCIGGGNGEIQKQKEQPSFKF